MNSVLSLIKLQSDSPEKKAAEIQAEHSLHKAEKKYITLYKQTPPTVTALVDPKVKKERITQMNQILVNASIKQSEARTNLRSHSVIALPKEEDLSARQIRSRTIASHPDTKSLIDPGLALMSADNKKMHSKNTPALVNLDLPKRGNERGN